MIDYLLTVIVMGIGALFGWFFTDKHYKTKLRKVQKHFYPLTQEKKKPEGLVVKVDIDVEEIKEKFAERYPECVDCAERMKAERIRRAERFFEE